MLKTAISGADALANRLDGLAPAVVAALSPKLAAHATEARAQAIGAVTGAAGAARLQPDRQAAVERLRAGANADKLRQAAIEAAQRALGQTP